MAVKSQPGHKVSRWLSSAASPAAGNGSGVRVLTPLPRPKAASNGGRRNAAQTATVNGTITVLIAEAFPLLRSGLAVALAEDPRLDVVAVVADPRAAAAQAIRLRPRVVIIGSQAQQIDCIQATCRIRKELPETAVIMIGASEEESVVFSAIEAGAVGYLLPDVTPEDLREAVHSVCNEMTMVHPRVARKIVDRLTLLSQKIGVGAAAGLTTRELELLLSMAAGRTDKEIAQELAISESTVKSHIRTVFQKTGAANRVQAVAVAMRVGLIR